MKAQQVLRTEKLGGGAPGAFIPSGVIDRRGVQAATQATGQLAQGLFEFGQMVQTSVRRDMVSHSYALAQRDVADAELAVKSDPDHRSIPGKFSQALDDIRASRADQIPDPVARNMFQRKMLEYGTSREIQMKYYAGDREIDAQKGNLLEGLDTKLDLIDGLALEDRTGYARYDAEAEDLINEKTANGIITAETGVKMKADFRDKAATVKARQHIIIDPAGAVKTLGATDYEKYYPGLDAERRLTLFEKAQSEVAANNKAETHLQEQIEKIAAKETKKVQTQNYGDAVVMYSNDKLDEKYLRTAIDNRDIDPEKGMKMISRLRTDARQGKIQNNNPAVVGDLARKIALGMNVTTELNDALTDGDIKDETFITLSTNMAKQNVQDGIGYINRGMQPSEFETDPNLKRTWADGIDLFWERVGRGEDPMKAARDIVRRRRKTLPIPIGRPRYLRGTISGTKDFRDAMELTVKAFKKGEIGPVEANQEAELIELYIGTIETKEDLDMVIEQMNKEIK